MELKTKYYKTRNDGVILVVTQTNNNCYIKQVETGALCTRAVDI